MGINFHTKYFRKAIIKTFLISTYTIYFSFYKMTFRIYNNFLIRSLYTADIELGRRNVRVQFGPRNKRVSVVLYNI